jgi:hypothetical protein
LRGGVFKVVHFSLYFFLSELFVTIVDIPEYVCAHTADAHDQGVGAKSEIEKERERTNRKYTTVRNISPP